MCPADEAPQAAATIANHTSAPRTRNLVIHCKADGALLRGAAFISSQFRRMLLSSFRSYSAQFCFISSRSVTTFPLQTRGAPQYSCFICSFSRPILVSDICFTDAQDVRDLQMAVAIQIKQNKRLIQRFQSFD